jgi:hypothetical protein
MFRKILFLALFLFLVLAGTGTKTYANNGTCQMCLSTYARRIREILNGEEAKYLTMHYIFTDESFNESWVSEKIYVGKVQNADKAPNNSAECGSISGGKRHSLEEKIIFLFENLFARANFMPPDVKILSCEIDEGCLNLNVSDDILHYYGSYTETRMISQIIKTALDIPHINRITLSVEGEVRPLLEGSLVFKAEKIDGYYD